MIETERSVEKLGATDLRDDPEGRRDIRGKMSGDNGLGGKMDD